MLKVFAQCFVITFFFFISFSSIRIYAGTEVLDLFYANTHSMQADFEQSISERFGKVLEQSSGSLVIQRPNQFALNYHQPDQQQYISNGKTLWIYDVDLEQVTIKAFDESLADSPALLISSNKNIRQSYTIIEAYDPKKPDLDIFKLTPKQDIAAQGEGMFSQVYLIFKQGKLVELTMEDNFDQVTTLKFKQIKVNEKLTPGTFSLKIPDNVDVIGTIDNSAL